MEEQNFIQHSLNFKSNLKYDIFNLLVYRNRCVLENTRKIILTPVSSYRFYMNEHQFRNFSKYFYPVEICSPEDYGFSQKEEYIFFIRVELLQE